MNVGLIGCGAMGWKRAHALAGNEISFCFDPNRESALRVANAFDCCATISARDVLTSSAVDIVIVSTPTEFLSEIVIEALQAGKHVLVEKPAANSVAEIDAMIEAEENSLSLVRVGFNLRSHRAVRFADDMTDRIGETLFVRAHYGHGGRENYGDDWRMKDPRGETLDQGIHLIDLASFFLWGEFVSVSAESRSGYWSQADDNCFLTLRTDEGKIASLHASCTEWRNQFFFEIVGTRGKMEISGLGGSYGTEKLTLYEKGPDEGKPPMIRSWEWPTEDDSLEYEMREFTKDIRRGYIDGGGLLEAKKALKVIEKVYSQKGEGR